MHYVGWPGMNTGLSVAIIILIIIHSNSPSSLYYTAMPCHTIRFARCIHSKYRLFDLNLAIL